jgi:hypothetical protein
LSADSVGDELAALDQAANRPWADAQSRSRLHYRQKAVTNLPTRDILGRPIWPRDAFNFLMPGIGVIWTRTVCFASGQNHDDLFGALGEILRMAVRGTHDGLPPASLGSAPGSPSEQAVAPMMLMGLAPVPLVLGQTLFDKPLLDVAAARCRR